MDSHTRMITAAQTKGVSQFQDSPISQIEEPKVKNGCSSCSWLMRWIPPRACAGDQGAEDRGGQRQGGQDHATVADGHRLHAQGSEDREAVDDPGGSQQHALDLRAVGKLGALACVMLTIPFAGGGSRCGRVPRAVDQRRQCTGPSDGLKPFEVFATVLHEQCELIAGGMACSSGGYPAWWRSSNSVGRFAWRRPASFSHWAPACLKDGSTLISLMEQVPVRW